MNERPSMTTILQNVDDSLKHDANVDRLGAVSINAVLEAMFVQHGRVRLVGADFVATRVVHRALVNLPSASAEERGTDPLNRDETNNSETLAAMDRAGEEAEALKQAAQ